MDSGGETKKTEEEGGGTAIVAATMEEESGDNGVGVGIERTSPPPFGAGKIEAEDESGDDDLRRKEDSRGRGGRGGGRRGDRGRGAQ